MTEISIKFQKQNIQTVSLLHKIKYTFIENQASFVFESLILS